MKQWHRARALCFSQPSSQLGCCNSQEQMLQERGSWWDRAQSSPRQYSEGEQSSVWRENKPWPTQIWGSLQKIADKFNPGVISSLTSNSSLYLYWITVPKHQPGLPNVWQYSPIFRVNMLCQSIHTAVLIRHNNFLASCPKHLLSCTTAAFQWHIKDPNTFVLANFSVNLDLKFGSFQLKNTALLQDITNCW